ncbi:MAG: hypothetical protein HY315_10850 [Acidobacteria bacterium]|nr:hypothetical protein [Acidobacteriota bacterium]
MKRHPYWFAFFCGSGLVIVAFVLMFVPVAGRIGEIALEPGYYLPEAYWDGIHDPLQLLLVLLLNIVFYVALFAIIFRLRRDRGTTA